MSGARSPEQAPRGKLAMPEGPLDAGCSASLRRRVVPLLLSV